MQELAEINFLDINEEKTYEELIQKVINKCFTKEKIIGLNIYISITLTTPEQIQKLNAKYRNIDKQTDVLSFPMFEKIEIDNIIEKQEKQNIFEALGDIVVSIERVKEQAEEYGHSFERELSYMIVHGFYHLMGYDHIEESDKVIMRQKEEEILEELKITRDI